METSNDKRIKELEAELNDKQRMIDRLNIEANDRIDSIYDLKAKLMEKEDTITYINEGVEDLRRVIVDLNAKLEDRDEEIDKFRKSIDEKEKIIRNLYETIGLKNESIDRLTDRTVYLNTEVDELSLKLCDKEKEIACLKDRAFDPDLEAYRNENKILKGELDKKTEAYERLCKVVSDRATEISNFKQKIREMEKHSLDVFAEKCVLKNQIRDLEEKVTKYKNANDNTCDINDRLYERLELKDEQIDDLKAIIVNLEASLQSRTSPIVMSAGSSINQLVRSNDLKAEVVNFHKTLARIQNIEWSIDYDPEDKEYFITIKHE